MIVRNIAVIVAAWTLLSAYPASAQSSQTSKDCETCPELAAVPAGKFQMGDFTGAGFTTERPVRTITFSKPFAIGIHEITFDQWDACVADGGCGHKPGDNGFGRANRPVINVSWQDARLYTAWLSKKMGKKYRLPTEAEWEYVARAGTTTNYPWGDEAGADQANCSKCGPGAGESGPKPVGSFKANSFGLFDTSGNVAEWIQDCYTNDGIDGTYTGLPTNGAAAPERDSCFRVIRGGSWRDEARAARSSSRDWLPEVNRNGYVGFRVVRSAE
ncbi:MAG: formylglycine-generating enzyme family protein [Rhodospirillaceae bacterium]|nr:formylglycine-generating enzyme family protein [Rhodospirillaceae bacterium]